MDKNNNRVLIAIVVIVAIVGIVALFMNSSNKAADADVADADNIAGKSIASISKKVIEKDIDINSTTCICNGVLTRCYGSVTCEVCCTSNLDDDEPKEK